jgi:pectinesterase
VRGFPLILAALLAAAPLRAQTNITVAADGSGQFKSVEDAIMSVPSGSAANPVIIHIKPGVYHELVYVQREKTYFRLLGDDAAKTIIVFNLYASMTNVDGKPLGTFRTPTATIDADNFTAENITFQNDAGPVGQALAIRVDGDRAAFRRCRFLGWQDTILLNRGRQYFEDCYIAGHVDFIFGAATAWFENCHIHCLQDGYITAASTPQDMPFGYVFSHCQIDGETGVKTFLGRPWRIYASVTWLNCDMSDVVRPEGWFDWKKPQAHLTARYAEFENIGPGANPTNRVDWSKQLTEAEAKKITVDKVLGGADGWVPTAPFYTTCRDIQYGEAGGQKLLLDVHVPDGDGKFPVLIIVHGGGWSFGNKEAETVPAIAPYTTNFTWFSIDYRLAPTNRWPACFDDVQTAIRWVKDHATEYKGDPDRIALIGYSAGGHLVCYAATQAGNDTRVQAVVGLAPPTDLAIGVGALLLPASGAFAQNMFVGSYGSNSVVEIPTSGPQSTFATGMNYPNALAFNSSGDLFVANWFAGTILEYGPGGGTPTTFASDLTDPTSLAFDSEGDLFVACQDNTILKYAAGGGSPTSFGSGLNSPYALAFNSVGDLFVANAAGDVTGAGYIQEFTPGGAPTTVATGLSTPNGLAFNTIGDLFITEGPRSTASSKWRPAVRLPAIKPG